MQSGPTRDRTLTARGGPRPIRAGCRGGGLCQGRIVCGWPPTCTVPRCAHQREPVDCWPDPSPTAFSVCPDRQFRNPDRSALFGERKLDQLALLQGTHRPVVRDRKLTQIATTAVVLGDMVELCTGDHRVPATRWLPMGLYAHRRGLGIRATSRTLRASPIRHRNLSGTMCFPETIVAAGSGHSPDTQHNRGRRR